MNGIKQRISDWQPRKLLCFSAAFSIVTVLCTLCVSYDIQNWIAKIGIPIVVVGVLILSFCSEKLFSFTLGVIFGLVWCICFTNIIYKPACKLDGFSAEMELRVLEYYTAGESASIEVTVLERKGISRETKARLYLQDKPFSLRPGDRLKLAGVLRKEDTTLSRNRLQKGIYLTVTLIKDTEITVESDGARNLMCKAARLSHAIQNRIQGLIPGEEGNLLAAMISGDSSICGDKLQKALVNTGLAHIAAVSGLHISILTGFFVTVLGRRNGFLVSLPLIMLYAVVAGASPSAMRAVIMQVILMLSVFFYREYDAMTALFAALLLLLLQNPFSVLSASLLLSFSATFGILLMNGALLHAFGAYRPKGKLAAKTYHWLVSTISVSFSAMIFTIPVTLLIFGRASMISIISNLLTIWAVSIVMIGGMLMLFISVVAMPVAVLFAKGLRILLIYLVWIIEKLGGFTDFVGQSGSLVMELGAVLALACIILVRLSKRDRVIGVITTVLVLTAGFAFGSLETVLYNEVQIYGNYGAPMVLVRDGSRTIAIGTGDDGGQSGYEIEEALSAWNQTELSAVICLSDRMNSVGGLNTVKELCSPEQIFLPEQGTFEGLDAESVWHYSGSGVLSVPDTTGSYELFPLTSEIWGLRWIGGTTSFVLLFDGQPMELAVGLEDYLGDISADILITDASLLQSSHAAAYICGRVSPQVIFAADSSFDRLPTQVLGVPVVSLYEHGTITLTTKR